MLQSQSALQALSGSWRPGEQERVNPESPYVSGVSPRPRRERLRSRPPPPQRLRKGKLEAVSIARLDSATDCWLRFTWFLGRVTGLESELAFLFRETVNR